MSKIKKKIAITGGIGSGKSFVCKLLTQLGEVCYSCDEISKQLWLDEKYQQALSSLFPSATVNGKIVKERLANIVFNDKESLERLNAFSHPQIMSRLFEAMEKCNKSRVFAEVPLLFEGGFEKEFDEVIIVLRNRDKRIQAVAKRDGVAALVVENKIKLQFDYDINLQQLKNYFTIKNNSTVDDLKEEVVKILNIL